MKNVVKCIGIVALTAVIGFSMTSCTTTNANIDKKNMGQFSSVDVAAKDFTTLGLVFTETVVTHNRQKDSVTASGEVLTYQALLQEAQKLGADAIINIKVDARIESTGSKTRFLFFKLADTEERIETWYGSALAIRYGAKLVNGDIASGAYNPAAEESAGNQSSGGGNQGLLSKLNPFN